MSASIFLDYDCEEIAAAMSLALAKFSNSHPTLTYTKIGKKCEREKQSIHQWICGLHEIPSTCWLKLTAEWPELDERLLFELDGAEKAFRARQRELRLPDPMPEEKAA